MQNAKLRMNHCAFEILRFTLQRPHPQAGFTLIELALTLALLGLILALVLPRITTTPTLSASARQLVGTIHSLFTAAASTKRAYRLHVDLDQQIYWATVLTTDGDRLPSDPSLVSRTALPSTVGFQDIHTVRYGKVTSGRIFIQFFPGGRVEPAVVHLSNQAQQVLTLVLNPLTGGVRIADHYLERSAPGVPEAYLSFFQPLPARSDLFSMGATKP